MALPSSRRPVEVEEELREEDEKFNRDLLKIKVNLNKVFMETMADWYHHKLKASKKQSLRRKDVIIKAQSVCSKLKMRYERLPQTWLKKLHEDFSVDFIWEHPAEKAKQRAIRRLRKAAIAGKLTIGEMKRKIEDLKSGILSPAAVEPNFSESEDNTPDPAPSELFKNEFSSKIVDLTKEPPPVFWVAAYAQGNHLPRVMKCFSDDETGQTIIYYDYGPDNFKDSDKTHWGTFMVHESNNFLSYRKWE